MVSEKIQKWIDENQGKHFCNCPCHGVIVIKPHHHYYGIPKYIASHQNRIIKKKKSVEIDKWIEDNQGKYFCNCPCRRVIIIKRSHYYDGIPKYIWGHGSSLHKEKSEEIQKWIEDNQGKHFCKHCGRVIKIQKHHYYAGIPEYINRHNGTMTGKHHTKESKQKNREKHLGRLIGDNNPSKRPEVRKKLSENNPMKKPEVRKKVSGQNSYLWIDGRSFEPYCYKFNNSLKWKIRERDNYQCQYPLCLCNQLEHLLLYRQSLHVHHIHYDKENCYPDLITLCGRHNTMVNSDRNHYEQLFVSILEKRNLLNYFEDIKQ